jgi:phage terminase large subunit
MNSFEEMTEDDFVFNFTELLAAKNREYAPRTGYGHRILGFDIARYGNDKCAAVGIEQIGSLAWRVFNVEQWDHRDLDYTTGRILSTANTQRSNDNIIDEDGIGSGPLDFITKGRQRDDFRGFRNAGLSYDDNAYYCNPRTAAAFKLKEYVSKGWIQIQDEGLMQELMTLRYKFTNDGRKILISKEEMRKKGVKSPNMADALLMAASLIGEVREEQDNRYRSNRPVSYADDNLFAIAGVR